MEQTGIIGTVLLIITGFFTYMGFRDRSFFEENLFRVDPILIQKDYKRLISSGFLHAGWIHFGLNMIALLSFSSWLEHSLGYIPFLLLYFISMLGGSLLALYIHRNHGDYSAVGASGAVSGVVFASIVLDPMSKIGFVFIPIYFPAWALGVAFVLISILGIKNQTDNIGHEAHLGGLITGMLCTVLIKPGEVHWWIFFLVLIPCIYFLGLVAKNPSILLVKNYWGENFQNIKDSFNRQNNSSTPTNQSDELDRLLDKIRENGINSLTKKERERLEELKNDL